MHERKHTCRVCHSELDFAFKVNLSEITEAENQAGEFCGVCHMTVAFPMSDCKRCHPAMQAWP